MTTLLDEGYVRLLSRRYRRQPSGSGLLVAQLYCYWCGEELDGEQHSRGGVLNTGPQTSLQCDDCGFWLFRSEEGKA